MSAIFRRKPGLVVYLTCGDPDLPTARDVALAAIEAGADVIELGVPFSDPVADGPVIQRASERALARGTRLSHVLKVAREIRDETSKRGLNASLIVFSYLNPVLHYGLDKFAEDALSVGIDGALITDLIVEEAADYLRAMRSRNLATVFLAAPTSPDQRLQTIAKASTGFVYAVSRTGVTGAQQELPADARDLVARLRQCTDLPVAVGFGISTREQFAAVGEFADAAVIGSAIVQLIEENPGREAQTVGEFISQLHMSQATMQKSD